MAKTAQELLKEMEAEIASKVSESVELNKESIDQYVEAKKVEAYNECVAQIKDAVEAQYIVAKEYLKKLVDDEEKPATAETPVEENTTTNTTETEATVEEPVATVEGPQTL